MKGIWGRYLNEIVGLTIMALMALALIAGQAQAIQSHDSIDKEVRELIEIRLTISN
jgi:hypothetical protein